MEVVLAWACNYHNNGTGNSTVIDVFISIERKKPSKEIKLLHAQ